MTQQFYHEFKGFIIHPSRCLVKIFSDDGENLICFEDIGEGTSVTNASEQLASEIVSQLKFNPKDCRFFETYQEYNYDGFDEIEYDWVKKIGIHLNGQTSNIVEWEAKHPKWRSAEKEIKDLFIT